MAQTFEELRNAVAENLRNYEGVVNPKNKSGELNVLFFRLKGHGLAGVARKGVIETALTEALGTLGTGDCVKDQEAEYLVALARLCYDTYHDTRSTLVDSLRRALISFCHRDSARIIIVARVILRRYQGKVNPSDQHALSWLRHFVQGHGSQGRERAEAVLNILNNSNSQQAEENMAEYCRKNSHHDSLLLYELQGFCSPASQHVYYGQSDVVLLGID
ncbi:MAG: hypothetical protein KAS93_07135 [Gammaproteobacteria bacterium]|nr:hypothetical protein [Gammaproteobacteria bacterium]